MKRIAERRTRAAEFRRMAQIASEAERERKLLALADRWEDEARQLEQVAQAAEPR
jgi:hypothetical protein